jgi:hypothetical protein
LINLIIQNVSLQILLSQVFINQDLTCLSWIVQRFTMMGMSRNISCREMNVPGESLEVLCIAVQVACIVVASAESTSVWASCSVCGKWVNPRVRITLLVVWCILLQIALDCGFFIVVGMSLSPLISRMCWSSVPMN